MKEPTGETDEAAAVWNAVIAGGVTRTNEAMSGLPRTRVEPVT